MNWEAIGAVGEITGAAAVVASLLYLAVQTRTNARALRANAIWDAETIFGDVNYQHGANPEWASLLGRALVPDASMIDFNATEQSQLQFTIRGAFQYFQAQWSLFEEGLLPNEIWERRRRFIRGLIELPVVKAIWEAEIQQHIIPEDFRQSIESAPLESKVFIGRLPGAAESEWGELAPSQSSRSEAVIRGESTPPSHVRWRASSELFR